MNLIGFTIFPIGRDLSTLKDNWEMYFELKDFNHWLRDYDENELVFVYSPDHRTKKVLSIFGKYMLKEKNMSMPSFLFFVYLDHDDSICVDVSNGNVIRIFSRSFKRLGGKNSKDLRVDLVEIYGGRVREGKYLQLNSRLRFFGLEN